MLIYPRVCGEKARQSGGMVTRCGSSPHVRGTGGQRLMSPVLQRFIPARAGNRVIEARRPKRAPVHPRTCGEQDIASIAVNPLGGSSPHVPGTVTRRQTCRCLPRFIPARAGNSPATRCRPGKRAVHPRTCGEQVATVFIASSAAGSSPHVRGTVADAPEFGQASRFIPARAGNSWHRQNNYPNDAVHPRTCGEQSSCRILISLRIFGFKERTDFHRPFCKRSARFLIVKLYYFRTIEIHSAARNSMADRAALTERIASMCIANDNSLDGLGQGAGRAPPNLKKCFYLARRAHGPAAKLRKPLPLPTQKFPASAELKTLASVRRTPTNLFPIGLFSPIRRVRKQLLCNRSPCLRPDFQIPPPGV